METSDHGKRIKDPTYFFPETAYCVSLFHEVELFTRRHFCTQINGTLFQHMMEDNDLPSLSFNAYRVQARCRHRSSQTHCTELLTAMFYHACPSHAQACLPHLLPEQISVISVIMLLLPSKAVGLFLRPVSGDGTSNHTTHSKVCTTRSFTKHKRIQMGKQLPSTDSSFLFSQGSQCAQIYARK